MTTTTALVDVVDELLLIGRVWGGPLPADLADTSTARRIRSAAFSVLTLLDGDTSVGPVRLSPKEQLAVDLGGQDLHELLGGDLADVDDVDQRRLLEDLQQLVDQHATRPGPADVVVGAFLQAVCELLADGYELRPIGTDTVTDVQAAGDDTAPGLPAAFVSAWTTGH